MEIYTKKVYYLNFSQTLLRFWNVFFQTILRANETLNFFLNSLISVKNNFLVVKEHAWKKKSKSHPLTLKCVY